MISFVSIIKLDSGVASYKVVERPGNDYTAYLVRNASSQSLPQELTIDRQKARKSEDDGDPVVEKLITAIKNNASLEEDPL